MYTAIRCTHRDSGRNHAFCVLIVAQFLDRAMNAECAICDYLRTELLHVMEEHLKAECDLYTAALVLKDTRLTHEHNLRAAELIERSRRLREEFDVHVRAEHRADSGLNVMEAAT
jgi:hypothetical protein